MNKEVEARYKALLARANDLLFYQSQGTSTPALMRHAGVWLDDYRQLTNEQQQAQVQLSLWEGQPQAQQMMIDNQAGQPLDISVWENRAAETPTTVLTIRKHTDGNK